jgi:HlyD family secretion protein
MIQRLVAVAVVALLIIGGLLYSQNRTGPYHVSGFVENDEIRVGSRVGGRVAKVFVEEGDRVKKGQALVELDPYQFLEQRAQAQGLLAQAEAELRRLTAGYRPEELAQSQAREAQLEAARDKLAQGEEDITAALAALELARAQRDLALLKYKRTDELQRKNSASQADLDQATAERDVAQATVKVREQELAKLKRIRPIELREADARGDEARQEVLLRTRGYRSEEIDRAKAAVDAARAAVAAIDRQIEELTIRAPADGAVEAVQLRPGDMVGAGAPAISIVEAERLWVRAYVPENRMNLQIGQKVSVTVGSLPGETFLARIVYVARQAEFTPGNVQTPEERSKQVFRIKVVLEEGLDRVRPGMSADVWFDPRGHETAHRTSSDKAPAR